MQKKKHMDWYSWLSRTSLETSFLYEYTLVFNQNELQKEDIVYFTHDFLQSLGISVAKHRLEILKLVHKDLENSSQPNGFGIEKLVLAYKKTKKIFNKWISHHKKKNSSSSSAAQMLPFEFSKGQSVVTCKNVTKSGPLDRGLAEQMMVSDKWISISGPLDGKLYQEKWMATNQSPTQHGHRVHGNKSPLAKHYGGGGGDGNLSPWSLMFHDMKPT